MKCYPVALGLAALIFAGTAHADDQDTARRCLAHGKKVMADNREILALLKRSAIDRQSVREDRYDEQVGSQHIATQLTAELRDGGRPTGFILCLIENEKPLYFYFHSQSGPN
ncbi:hypothetical protein [Paraburkholderia sacchari]|uniref:hypothetical protein n=1 Tax=Paraburkholderia sacchari TaxID=159450 RepID=UPI001BCF2606|nr:hypothetical protein [Paraburkholderia sacchari]